jgi:hypothetical protein
VVLFLNPKNNEIFGRSVAKNIELDRPNEKMSFQGKAFKPNYCIVWLFATIQYGVISEDLWYEKKNM